MIYISTGGYKHSALDTSLAFYEHGIRSIELSGGLPFANYREKLIEFAKKINFQIHNYFPPPANPFVFNLASLDPDVSYLSYRHAVTAMELSVDLGNPVYSFHAGFLLDPNVGELGKKIANRKLFDRNHAMTVFLANINKLAERAQKLGVKLLIENNVLSENNYSTFNENPFLMATQEECMHVMSETPANVKLLIDVAHLKVSANSLGFDPVRFLEVCDSWIDGYHLSDNNGKRDSNECVSMNSWFWPFLKHNLNYYSLEIFNVSPEVLVQQYKLVNKQVNGIYD